MNLQTCVIFAVPALIIHSSVSYDSTNWFRSIYTGYLLHLSNSNDSRKLPFIFIFESLPHKHTYIHTPNRWTLSGGTVDLVSTLRPQQPPPSSVLWVSPSCSEALWVECALPAISIRMGGMSGDYSGFQFSSA